MYRKRSDSATHGTKGDKYHSKHAE